MQLCGMNIDVRKCKKCKTEFSVDLDEEKRLGYKILWCSDKCKESFVVKNCIKCGKQAYCYPKNKTCYCSDECRKDICTVCGKIYIPKNTESYCSEECKKIKYGHTCIACGENFFSYKLDAKFCNINCKSSFKSYEKKHSVCKYCKKIITSFGNIKVDYCSSECRIQSYKNNRRKKEEKEDINEITLLEMVKSKVIILLKQRKNIQNSFEWTKNYYDVKFIESVKKNVRQRDNNRCYICDDFKSLEVHHIVPRRLGGNHSEENLITLCTKCHRYIETNNEEYATNKCFNKAKQTYGIEDFVLKEQFTNKQKFIEVKEELEQIYKKISETISDDSDEVLIKISNLIDSIETHNNS